MDSAGQRTTALLLVAFVTACAIARPTRPETGTETGRECVNRCDEDRTACHAGTSDVTTGSASDWRNGLIALFGASLNSALARRTRMKALASCYASCRGS